MIDWKFVPLATVLAVFATSDLAAQQTDPWKQISVKTVNEQPISLAVQGKAGPSVFQVQTLLDRALFSPGIIDGRWGKNTRKAVYWMQKREGLNATGRVNQATLSRLKELAGNPQQIARSHTLTAEDVAGPFVEIPEDIYKQAKLECSCYESLSEKLGEMFHTSPAILKQLNPDVNLDTLKAGSTIMVPNTRDKDAGNAKNIARLVISDGGHYLHAMDSDGKIAYHFPSTLGADYAPSPDGNFKVTSITKRPTWHYQPDILERVDDSRPDATIPAGPNNAVGVVWMELSKPHYGIHGTSAPETIGYAQSHGCVRLTNWDALFLADRVEAGIPVSFVNG